MIKKPYEILKNKLSSKPSVRIKLLGDSITHGEGGTGIQFDPTYAKLMVEIDD